MEENLPVPEFEPLYRIEYEIASSLNYADLNRYCIPITGKILLAPDKEDDMPIEKDICIGQLSGFKVLVDLARTDGHNIIEVFDLYREVIDIAQEIWDLKKGDYKSAIRKHYEGLLYESELLVLSRLEILHPYRGKGIGKRAIKDFYNHFIGGCTLLAIKCYPLQHEAGIFEEDNPFSLAMQYNTLEKDYKKALHKLISFYKGIGFEQVPGINKMVMLVNPLSPRFEFEEIELD